MPHIDIIGQDMSVRVLFWKVQYLFVNPAYLLEGLTGDTGISMASDSLISHLQPEIWAPLVTENPVLQFLPHLPPHWHSAFVCLRVNTG